MAKTIRGTWWPSRHAPTPRSTFVRPASCSGRVGHGSPVPSTVGEESSFLLGRKALRRVAPSFPHLEPLVGCAENSMWNSTDPSCKSTPVGGLAVAVVCVAQWNLMEAGHALASKKGSSKSYEDFSRMGRARDSRLSLVLDSKRTRLREAVHSPRIHVNRLKGNI